MEGEAAPQRGGHASDPGDPELILGIAAGSEEAFRVLFDRWAPRLGRFLLRATGSRETAEDLLQETFIRVWKAAPRFEPRGSVGAWIYRIGANLVYSHWRRECASPFTIVGHGEADAAVAPGAESARARGVFEREAAAALDRVPPNQRLVFLMKVDQGLTYEQIADALSCPVGTAKSRFHFAVRKMREEMKGWTEDDLAREGGPDVV